MTKKSYDGGNIAGRGGETEYGDKFERGAVTKIWGGITRCLWEEGRKFDRLKKSKLGDQQKPQE